VSSETQGTGSFEQRLQAVLAEYLQQAEAGRAPDRAALLAAHPDLAAELQAFFANRERFEQAAQPLRNEVETIGLEARPGTPTRRVTYFGDYILEDEIDRGGMGIVYEARQVKLNRVVALKMILRGELASAADVQRFRAEAEAAANLDHPHIVPIYEVGEHQGQHYFTMKRIEGGNLGRLLAAGAADLYRLIALLAKVARAVHHAHQRGILHRDLKPGNILVDAQHEPHVTDFGLAKRTGGAAGQFAATRTGAIVGTPAYMAPEQARGARDLTTAVDVYSLGAILYQVLVGQPPVPSDSGIEVLRQVAEKEPPRPRALRPAVDRDLETICLKCLDKDPARRYRSAESLAEDLERWSRHEPISARPVGAAGRAWRWCRRNPVVAGLLATVLLSIVSGTVLTMLNAVEARRQAERAEQNAAAARASAEAAAREKARADSKADDLREEKRLGERRRYVARMNLVQQMWENGRLGALRGLLDMYRDDTAEPQENRGLRGFEWYYWERQSDLAEATLRGRTSFGINGVAYAPDGKCLAGIGSHDVTRSGNLQIWTPGAAAPPRLIDLGWNGAESLAWHPRGEQLATRDDEHGLRLWDSTSGELIAEFKERDRAPDGTPLGSGRGVAFSPDGSRLAAGGDPLTVWDASTRKRVFQSDLLHAAAVSYSADGKRLAACGTGIRAKRDGDGAGPSALVWDTGTWQVLLREPFAQGDCNAVALSPDGTLLACATGKHDNLPGAIRIFEVAGGKEVRVLRDHRGRVNALAYSRDGRQLASASSDRTACLWDVQTGTALRVFKGHSASVVAVAFRPDSQQVATASYDNTVKLWDPRPPAPPPGGNDRFQRLNSAEFSPDGARLLLSGTPRSGGGGAEPRAEEVEVWDLARNQRVLALPEAGSCGASFSPDGKHIASGDAASYQHRRDEHPPIKMLTPPRIFVWDAATGAKVMTCTGHGDSPGSGSSSVSCPIFSPDGTRIVSAGQDRTVRIWDAATGKELARHTDPPKDTLEHVRAVAYSRDGSFLVSASREFRAADVWDAATLRPRHLLRHAAPVTAIAISPDSRLIATGSEGRDIQLWDAATGKSLRTLVGHGEEPTCLTFSPDGERLASGSRDATVKLWDVISGQETVAFRNCPGAVIAIAFHPDGQRLVATSGGLFDTFGASVVLWDARPRKK
jgi:WD40 repeat protein/tRNA A-37 threonylcarbamoyl transferase component Bud32